MYVKIVLEFEFLVFDIVRLIALFILKFCLTWYHNSFVYYLINFIQKHTTYKKY